eukprot:COSAG06_NODE_57678_length_279_cov_1.150000_1_plen_88_part_01
MAKCSFISTPGTQQRWYLAATLAQSVPAPSEPDLHLRREGSVSQGPYCGFPALSCLDYDTAVPNARYHAVKLLIDEMGSGDSVKAFSS